MDATTFSEKLSSVATTDVHFESLFDPANATLQPLFQTRQGADDLRTRYQYQRDFANISSTSDARDIAADRSDGVLYYHQTHVGNFAAGAEIAWATTTKLKFDVGDRKITNISLTVVDPLPIDQAYPTAF